ncbi:MAG: hypothetical protein ACLPN5_03760 [Roseiarcus sp.]
MNAHVADLAPHAHAGAAAAIRLALLPDDRPRGGFFSASGRDPW